MTNRRQQLTTAWYRRSAVAVRVLAAVVGGYACTVALAGSGAQLLALLGGMARSDAVILAAMLGFLLYLVLLLWSFAERKLWKIWAWLLAGTLFGMGLQYWLTPLLAARTLIER
ncbi:hypothetical protein [Pseudomonas sp. Q2-TVG4-2]|uniref:hypothetical protein n=1 Tax=Pseudomonas sp. Q2-TVG4-2 TaxID=1685699 RepID=UPI001C638B2A|nr:hypothetical protein [Pseudomonas sp. Q2-TVG4-2]